MNYFLLMILVWCSGVVFGWAWCVWKFKADLQRLKGTRPRKVSPLIKEGRREEIPLPPIGKRPKGFDDSTNVPPEAPPT